MSFLPQARGCSRITQEDLCQVLCLGRAEAPNVHEVDSSLWKVMEGKEQDGARGDTKLGAIPVRNMPSHPYRDLICHPDAGHPKKRARPEAGQLLSAVPVPEGHSLPTSSQQLGEDSSAGDQDLGGAQNTCHSDPFVAWVPFSMHSLVWVLWDSGGPPSSQGKLSKEG
jgi:hypothetical protein